MTAASGLQPIGTSHRTSGVGAQLRRIAQSRQLMYTLAARQIKTQHKASLLGLGWNLLNPLLQMTIYTVVFTYFMPGRLPMFPLKLLSSTAIFALFSMGVTGGTGSIVGNSSLVSKIWFPREILPLSAILANLVTFGSRLAIVLVASLFYWHPPEWSMFWLLLLATATTIVLAAGLALMLSCINVYFRDVSHFLELAMLAMFWFTPVIWNYTFLSTELINRFGPQWERLAMINPMTSIVITFQRVIYNPAALPEAQQAQFASLLRPTRWYVENLSISLAVGLVLLYAGLKVFSRLDGTLAENL